MNKVLFSVLSVSAIVAMAPAAYAQGNFPSGSTVTSTFNSVHTGSVAGTCALEVTDGTLATNQVLTSSLTTSGTIGSIKTLCNTTTSTITVEIVPGVAGTDYPAANKPNDYSEKFKLDNPSGGIRGAGGPYVGINTGFVSTYTTSDLSDGMSGIPSKVDVIAQASVKSPAILAAGNYKVTVKATVTP